MTSSIASMTTVERRRALRLGIVQGALWSVGNGWTTGSLVTYLAQELGGAGRAVSALLAWQALAGGTRLLAPAIIRTLGGVKPAAIAILLISYGLLASVPVLAIDSFSLATRLRFFVGLLAIHQLLEHLGSTALLTWLGELAPARIRGRYFARRQRWQLAVLVPASLAAAMLMDYLHPSNPDVTRPQHALAGYIIVMTAGALVLLLSVLPMLRMPSVEAAAAPRRQEPLATAFRDTRLVYLLVCGCWLSSFNGLSQSALYIYPKAVLKLPVGIMMILPQMMRLGQMALAGPVGRWSDRWGNKPVIIVSQACVAFGPLFFFLATPARPYWIAGAFVVWSAFVGLNVCLPNLMFRLAPAGQMARYTAIYFGLTNLAYGISTLGGGWLFDRWRKEEFWLGPWMLDVFGLFFLISWIGRLLGVGLASLLREPGAVTWHEIRARRRRKALPVAPV